MKFNILAAVVLIVFLPGFAFAEDITSTGSAQAGVVSSTTASVGGPHFNGSEPGASSAIAPSAMANVQWSCQVPEWTGAVQFLVVGASGSRYGQDELCNALRSALMARGSGTPIEKLVSAIVACQENPAVERGWQTIGITCSTIPTVMAPLLGLELPSVTGVRHSTTESGDTLVELTAAPGASDELIQASQIIGPTQ